MNENDVNEKKGALTSKNGTNAFFPKTESESRGLPLMNGGLKRNNSKILREQNKSKIENYKSHYDKRPTECR